MGWEGGWNPRRSLKGPTRGLTTTCASMGSLALSSSTGAAAQKVPGTHREELSCLASGEGLKGQLISR